MHYFRLWKAYEHMDTMCCFSSSTYNPAINCGFPGASIKIFRVIP